MQVRILFPISYPFLARCGAQRAGVSGGRSRWLRLTPGWLVAVTQSEAERSDQSDHNIDKLLVTSLTGVPLVNEQKVIP